MQEITTYDLSDRLIEDLGTLAMQHPTCSAYCDDAHGEHATLMWVGRALGSAPPEDSELAASFGVQCAQHSAIYLRHEPATEAPPPDPAWGGNLYLAATADDGGTDVLPVARVADRERVRSAADGEFVAYLVRWFFPVPLVAIRREFYAAQPDAARKLGFREDGR